MANNKLQELTERLYSEGLSKGKAEGEKILAEASQKADKMLSDARAEADKTIEEAKKKAADILAKAESDIRMAASQSMDATKTDIQNIILAKVVDGPVEKIMGNEEFTREVITAVAKAFSTEKSCEMSIVLPECCKGNIENYVRKEISSAIGKGIDVSLSKKIKGGLHIGPSDGAYYISLTDETFKELIKAYLRPATRKILFGE